MNQKSFIIIEEFCEYYSVEVSFIKQLNEHGMIELTIKDTSCYIHHDDICQLEKYIHLHYDLGINLEGLEAISHLLDKIVHLQNEIRYIRVN